MIKEQSRAENETLAGDLMKFVSPLIQTHDFALDMAFKCIRSPQSSVQSAKQFQVHSTYRVLLTKFKCIRSPQSTALPANQVQVYSVATEYCSAC